LKKLQLVALLCTLAAACSGGVQSASGEEEVQWADAGTEGGDAFADGTGFDDQPGDGEVNGDDLEPPADDEAASDLPPAGDGATDGGQSADGQDGGQHQGDGDASVWRPAPGTSWQWQLSGTIDTSIDVRMYDIDLFDAPQATIDKLHHDGRVVICYFSAGSYEEWRPDAADFPAQVLGKDLDGWPGERWLDVRAQAVRDIMQRRLDLAVAKGCDGVELDNVDGYQNDSGFPLTAADQLAYNRFLATEAHARGLSVGLKNDLDQVNQLFADFDWALNEECFKYDECDALLPFIRAGKAVFQVEYGNASLAERICPQANALNFDTLIKKLELDAWRVPCR